mgnify:CR=1 FL=1
METRVDAEIERLEKKMTELRKSFGILYTMEMYEINAQIAILYKLKRKPVDIDDTI